MLESGVEPFPVSVPVTTTISAVRLAHPDLEPEATTGEVVGVAGRVVHMRVTGKLAFLSLQEALASASKRWSPFAEVGEESFELLKDLVDLGDHVFVSGRSSPPSAENSPSWSRSGRSPPKP